MNKKIKSIYPNRKKPEKVAKPKEKMLKIANDRGAIFAEVDGKTRRVVLNQMQFRQIMEMVYLLNNNQIIVSDEDYPTMLLLPLAEK